MKLKVFLPMLLCCGFLLNGAGAVPPPSQPHAKIQKTIMIKNFSGKIRIITPSQRIFIVSRGNKLPIIPFGSKIEVIEGKAIIIAGDAKIMLDKKQSVLVDKIPDQDTIEISAADKSMGQIKVKVGGSTILLEGGQQANVVSGDLGDKERRIEIVKGEVTIVTADGEKKIGQGSGITVSVVTPPSDDTLTADVTVIPEPLRQESEEASPSVP